MSVKYSREATFKMLTMTICKTLKTASLKLCLRVIINTWLCNGGILICC